MENIAARTHETRYSKATREVRKIYIQAPMYQQEFQLLQQQEILLLPNHIHYHRLHQQ